MTFDRKDDARVFAAVAHDDDTMDAIYALLRDHVAMLLEEGVLTTPGAVNAHALRCVNALHDRMREEAAQIAVEVCRATVTTTHGGI